MKGNHNAMIQPAYMRKLLSTHKAISVIFRQSSNESFGDKYEEFYTRINFDNRNNGGDERRGTRRPQYVVDQ